MKKLIICITYLALSAWNAGALNSNMVCEFPSLVDHGRWSHITRAQSLLFGILPPFIVVTPFVTGFYYDGWTLGDTCPHQ